MSASSTVTLPTGNDQHGLGTRLAVLETSGLAGQRIGAAFTPGVDGRMWAPMLELTGHREFEYGDPIRWDLIPQLQVSLSRRRHIAATAGARIPVGGPSRPSTGMVSLTWDWYEGTLWDGWR